MNMKLISRYADGFASVPEDTFLAAVNAEGKEQLSLMRAMVKQALGNDAKIVKKFELMKETDKKVIYKKSLQLRKLNDVIEGIKGYEMKPLEFGADGFEFGGKYVSLNIFNGKIIDLTHTDTEVFVEIELEKDARILNGDDKLKIKNNGTPNVVKFDCFKSFECCKDVVENSSINESAFNQIKDTVLNKTYNFYISPRFSPENEVIGGYIFILSTFEYKDIAEFKTCLPFVGLLDLQ